MAKQQKYDFVNVMDAAGHPLEMYRQDGITYFNAPHGVRGVEDKTGAVVDEKGKEIPGEEKFDVKELGLLHVAYDAALKGPAAPGTTRKNVEQDTNDETGQYVKAPHVTPHKLASQDAAEHGDLEKIVANEAFGRVKLNGVVYDKATKTVYAAVKYGKHKTEAVFTIDSFVGDFFDADGEVVTVHDKYVADLEKAYTKACEIYAEKAKPTKPKKVKTEKKQAIKVVDEDEDIDDGDGESPRTKGEDNDEEE